MALTTVFRDAGLMLVIACVVSYYTGTIRYDFSFAYSLLFMFVNAYLGILMPELVPDISRATLFFFSAALHDHLKKNLSKKEETN